MKLKENSSYTLGRLTARRKRTDYGLNTSILALAGCIAVIFFSSTSVAGQWSDEFFDYIWVLVLIGLAPYAPPYSLMHLLAEKGLHLILFSTLGLLL